MPTDPISTLEHVLAQLRAQLRAAEHQANGPAQAHLAEEIFAIKAQLDPLKRAAGLLDHFEQALLPLTSTRPRKHGRRRSSHTSTAHIAEIEALSAAPAGITAPIPPRFPSIHWLSGYRFGLGLRATPDPQ
jgi:hypothetical protein